MTTDREKALQELTGAGLTSQQDSPIPATFRANELRRRELRAAVLANMDALEGEQKPPEEVERSATLAAHEAREAARLAQNAHDNQEAFARGCGVGAANSRFNQICIWHATPLWQRLLHAIKGDLP